MIKSKIKTSLIVFSITTALMVGGCANTNKTTASYSSNEIADPIEPINRAVFKFNDILDKMIIEPIAKAYKAIIPASARSSVHNFMVNLKTPITLANNILQGDINGAGVTTARFFMNTTLGVGGLFDIGEKQGYPYKKEDFGQTLASWGVGDGFYLVLPIIGPSSLRDATGLAVDTLADPIRIAAHNRDEYDAYYAREALQGLDNRSRIIKAIDDMRINSLDYYAAIRSAYSQKRRSLIYNKKSGDKKITPSYEDFE